ncbi:hypothetical protein NFI96_010735, partial [Prochilodus magdalenae]
METAMGWRPSGLSTGAAFTSLSLHTDTLSELPEGVKEGTLLLLEELAGVGSSSIYKFLMVQDSAARLRPLTSAYPYLSDRLRPYKPSRSPSSLHRKRVPYERKSKRWQDVTNAVTKFIAREMLPMRLVESESFTELVNVLEPRYTVPSRKYFSGTALPTLYNDTRRAVEKEVQNLTHFATTTDLWSSRTSEPYLSLTIHFIDESWRLRSYCLQTSYFPESHTGEIIALGLKDALASWSLKEEAMVCMTTDSGANVVSALRINNWKRLPCFGHRLHIAIERSMRDTKIDRAIGVCKKVVGAFSNSWNLKKALADAQTQMKLPEHKLITESPTRWGSRQRMIERFVEQEKAIRHVLGGDKKRRQLIPSWQDIDVLESVSKALSPLLEFTDALSGEQVVTISYLKPVLSLFNSEVLAEKSDDTQLTKQIKESILDYLNTKYRDDNVDDLLSVASTLDPRFKNRYNDDDQMIMSTISSELMAMTTQEESSAPGPSTAKAEGAIAEGGAKDILTVLDRTVVAVESNKFLGTTVTTAQKWDSNISSITKKAQQRMWLLRQLRSCLVNIHDAATNRIAPNLLSNKPCSISAPLQ